MCFLLQTARHRVEYGLWQSRHYGERTMIDDRQIIALRNLYAQIMLLRASGKTVVEICDELKLSAYELDDAIKKAIAILKEESDFDELSPRTARLLKGEKLRTKADVIHAYKKGILYKIPNLGRVKIKEICDWIGVVDPKDMPNEKTIHQYKTYLEKHGYSVTLTRK